MALDLSLSRGHDGDDRLMATPAMAAEGVAEEARTKTSKPKKKVALRRPRGRRGGIKNRKPLPQQARRKLLGKADDKAVGQDCKVAVASKPGTAEHTLAIARFHTLEKQLAQADSPAEQARIQAEQASLGGLQAYQDASLCGGDSARGGETGKWCAQQLDKHLGHRVPVRLLDVGALQGTAYSKYPWIVTTSIDVNPRSDKVQAYDFFDFPVPASDDDRFDVVALSLVVNFVGDIAARGRMLRHALRYLKKDGARLLYLVLPRACVDNSRYCTHEHLQKILASCGWDDVIVQDDSKRLTRWLVRSSSPMAKWDGQLWPKREIKVGATLNNFCIVVK